MRPRTPIVGIPCDHRLVGPHPFHMVGEKYIAAARDGAGAMPLLIPVLAPAIPPADLIAASSSPARRPTSRRSFTAAQAPATA